MEAQEPQPTGAPVEPTSDILGPIGLSRRDFAKKVGGGSAAALGLMWAAPKVSTIRHAATAAVGSPPPGSTTTTTTTPAGPAGTISVDDPNPCAGTAIHIHADGFVPNTAVTIELDSAANVLGTTTANSAGKINVLYSVPLSGPFGAHTVKAVGVKPGGQTLVLSASVTIRTVGDCENTTEGSTVPPTTTATTAPASTTTPTPTTTKKQHEQSTPPQILEKGSNLPFTGMNSTDLALAGGAAALAGWAVYGIAGSRNDEDEDVGDGP
jgi:hypothetical protein